MTTVVTPAVVPIALAPEPGHDDDELVVLLDADGRPSGTARKADVHHRETPLHLAFSCWLLDWEDASVVDGVHLPRVLLTRRAATKRTWPLTWTNSFCGHPAPGESVEDAVRRRAGQELGVDLDGIEVALPDFRYTAVMADGTRENEVCPVYTARAVGPLVPDGREVAEYRWVSWEACLARADEGPDAISPWMREQLVQLDRRWRTP